MKTPENVRQEAIGDAGRLAEAGASLEMILVFFRDRGFDKIDSLNAVRMLYDKTMSEAKEMVDRSEAWSDRFRTDMQFREAAWKTLREIAASQDPNLPRISIK